MTIPEEQFDLVIVGGGPVGLFAAFLALKTGLKVKLIEAKPACNQVGRADALNARTLSILKHVGLLNPLMEIGKPCKTSSIFREGQFVMSESWWWDQLEGCEHKHFLMIGQSYLERLLVSKITKDYKNEIKWNTKVTNVKVMNDVCQVICDDGSQYQARFVLGADGPRSIVRQIFGIPFELTRPEIRWAVVDAEFTTDFPKQPHIIVFQDETADVAWIPREDPIDRFYIRIDDPNKNVFNNKEEIFGRVKSVVKPYSIDIKRLEWLSEFSVKEGVAERFQTSDDRVFLLGDACHNHSVNGGQGLNTGLSDAFNLVWKLSSEWRSTYEQERKPVAKSVIETSGKLVRTTKYEQDGNHANKYIDHVREYAGNITGMGIKYGQEWQPAKDFEVETEDGCKEWLFNLLPYNGKWHKVIFGGGSDDEEIDLKQEFNVLKVKPNKAFDNRAIVVEIRPDLYSKI